MEPEKPVLPATTGRIVHVHFPNNPGQQIYAAIVSAGIEEVPSFSQTPEVLALVLPMLHVCKLEGIVVMTFVPHKSVIDGVGKEFYDARPAYWDWPPMVTPVKSSMTADTLQNLAKNMFQDKPKEEQ